MFRKLYCLWFGHLRGKLVDSVKAEGKPEQRTYICMRCNATWKRNYKAKK